jgi:hypothetical protein
VSFKSREASGQARNRQESVGEPGKMAGRHYLTVVSRTCSCNECGARLREGGEGVYRNRPREIICKRCADKRGLVPRISTRWEREREKQRKDGGRRPGPMSKLKHESEVPSAQRRCRGEAIGRRRESSGVGVSALLGQPRRGEVLQGRTRVLGDDAFRQSCPGRLWRSGSRAPSLPRQSPGKDSAAAGTAGGALLPHCVSLLAAISGGGLLNEGSRVPRGALLLRPGAVVPTDCAGMEIEGQTWPRLGHRG